MLWYHSFPPGERRITQARFHKDSSTFHKESTQVEVPYPDPKPQPWLAHHFTGKLKGCNWILSLLCASQTILHIFKLGFDFHNTIEMAPVVVRVRPHVVWSDASISLHLTTLLNSHHHHHREAPCSCRCRCVLTHPTTPARLFSLLSQLPSFTVGQSQGC